MSFFFFGVNARGRANHISPCEKCQQVLNIHLCQAAQRQKNTSKHVLRGAAERFLSLERESYLNALMVLPASDAGRGPGVMQDCLSQFSSLSLCWQLQASQDHTSHSLAGSPEVCNNTLCPQILYGEPCLIFRSNCEFNCYKAGFHRSFMNIVYIWDLPCIKFAYISDNKLHSCCVGHQQMLPQGSRVITWCADWLGWFQSQGKKKENYVARLN